MALGWLRKLCAQPYGTFPPEVEKSIARTQRKGEALLRNAHRIQQMPRLGVTTLEVLGSTRIFSKLLRGEPVTYIDKLPHVAQRHVDRLTQAHREYGDSWCRRGGVGAFMMLARKMDRIELRLQKDGCTFDVNGDGAMLKVADRYDIFEHVRADTRPEGVADDIADLIDYLMLVEAKLRHDGHWPGETAQHRPDQEHPFGYEGEGE